MSDITDFYQQQATDSISDIPWLAQLQQDALTDFARMGFPTRKDEDWKYTSVDGFLKQRFTKAAAISQAFSISKAPVIPAQAGNHRQSGTKAGMDPRLRGDDRSFGVDSIPVSCTKIPFINGIMTDISYQTSTFPKGVLILPLAQALLSHAEKIKPWLGKILKQEHAFHALNTAMMHCGVLIYLPAGVSLAEPLLLTHWQDQKHQAAWIRHLVIAEAGSCATIIEDYQGDAAIEYFTNTVTEVHAAAGSTLTHYKIQRESKHATHMGHLAVNQATGSQVTSHMFGLGGKLVRSDITFNLQEPQASCFMNGIYAPGEGQHMDQHTLVTHTVPDCNSTQDYKGILTGHSRAVFNGRVVVAKDAQHTVAKQQNKNLLLSVGAEIDTKPQLEIFADDVVCTHGATVGQLEEDALFYLATRGIERAEAIHFLIQAFAAENVQAVTDVHLATWLTGLLNQQTG
jgi:Fe-S cluster assembly protein SufD